MGFMVFKALEWNGNSVRLANWLVVRFWSVNFLVLCVTARPFNSAQKKKILRPPGELKLKTNKSSLSFLFFFL